VTGTREENFLADTQGGAHAVRLPWAIHISPRWGFQMVWSDVEIPRLWVSGEWLGNMVISTKCRRDKCADDLASRYSHTKKEVVSAIVKTKSPQGSRVTALAQLSEKCGSNPFLHPWRETPADTMEHLGMQATLELLVANGNKLLKIIGCRRSQQSIKATFGNFVWCAHILREVVLANVESRG
jgi:hypothetical protein